MIYVILKRYDPETNFFFLIYQTKTIKEIQYQIINKGNNTKQKVTPKQKPLKIKTP